MSNGAFIGRRRELEALNGFYNSGRFEMVTIYGRRRVGKTELIKEFLRNKKSVYFLATEGNYKENLTGITRAVHDTTTSMTYKDFHGAIDAIYKLAQNEKIVLAIDEYPYLARSYKPFSSLLQHAIDHKFQKLNMMIILCGSSMSFMENEVDGYKSPLYGRRTGQLKLFPLDFETARGFFPNLKKQEQAVLYGITGGIPKYLLEVRQNQSLEDNIRRMFFRPHGLLFEEPNNLMKQELREPALYNTIIGAIATGSSRLNEIVTKIDAENFDSAKCNKYIKSLIDLHIVKRELPIMDKPTSKKSIYRLNDGMFRFWYRFVYPNLSQISLDYGDAVYNYISEQFSDFMGEVFESICKQYLWRENMAGRLPFRFADCGRWWGNNPIAKAEQEIDILAYNNGKLLFCECKWTNEQADNRVLDNLIDKSAMFDCEEKYYMLLSKSGFKTSLKKSESEQILLVDFKDM
jgi:AAA+ ATPase superfamily predicted ATPase